MFLLVGIEWCVKKHRRILLKSLSLILQVCPLSLVHVTSMVFEMGGTDIVSWGVTFWICSLLAFLCNSHLVFSRCVLLATIWCLHIVVMTQPQLGRNTVLFYQIDQASSMIDDQSIATYTFIRPILTPLSVDWTCNIMAVGFRFMPLGLGWEHFRSVHGLARCNMNAGVHSQARGGCVIQRCQNKNSR